MKRQPKKDSWKQRALTKVATAGMSALLVGSFSIQSSADYGTTTDIIWDVTRVYGDHYIFASNPNNPTLLSFTGDASMEYDGLVVDTDDTGGSITVSGSLTEWFGETTAIKKICKPYFAKTEAVWTDSSHNEIEGTSSDYTIFFMPPFVCE